MTFLFTSVKITSVTRSNLTGVVREFSDPNQCCETECNPEHHLNGSLRDGIIAEGQKVKRVPIYVYPTTRC